MLVKVLCGGESFKVVGVSPLFLFGVTVLKNISYLSSYGGAHRAGVFQGQWFQQDRRSSVF